MDFVYVLLPLALLLGLVGLLGFMWALKSGQYDDLDGAAWRAIMDDDADLIPHAKKSEKPVNNPQEPVDNPEKSGE